MSFSDILLYDIIDILVQSEGLIHTKGVLPNFLTNCCTYCIAVNKVIDKEFVLPKADGRYVCWLIFCNEVF